MQVSGKLAIIWNCERLTARVEGRRRKRERLGDRWCRIVDFVEVGLWGIR